MIAENNEMSDDAIVRQTNFAFLLKDFEKIFDVYLYSHKERSEATKMFITICTVPFVLLSLLGIATKIDFTVSTFNEIIKQFPSFIFLLFSICGVLGVVPFHRFVAAHCNSYKMIRYMNNYRLFYYQLIQDDLIRHNWHSAIEKDPRNPKPKAISVHWTTFFALGMVTVNTTYFCLGLVLWENSSSIVAIFFGSIIMIAFHLFLAKSELGTKDIDILENTCTPIDKLLDNINNDLNREGNNK